MKLRNCEGEIEIWTLLMLPRGPFLEVFWLLSCFVPVVQVSYRCLWNTFSIYCDKFIMECLLSFGSDMFYPVVPKHLFRLIRPSPLYKRTQNPLWSYISPWALTWDFTVVLTFVNRRYTKGVPFLSKTLYKTVRGWTSGRNLRSRLYKTLLSSAPSIN